VLSTFLLPVKLPEHVWCVCIHRSILAIGLGFNTIGGGCLDSTLGTELIISSAPPEKAGAASALAETGAEFGGAVGIAVFGSIGVAIYRARMDTLLNPTWPSEVQRAAQDTLGGAVASAAQLPLVEQTGLLQAARHAFMEGMQLTSIAGALLMLLASVLAYKSLKHLNAHG